MRRRRKKRKIIGTSDRPRLSVFKANKHIYAQVIDDLNSKTLAAAGTLKKGAKNTSNIKAASKVGEEIAQKAKEKGVTKVVFDRGVFIYHGRIKALAESARKGGLVF
ncbi:MAG: 50S ribosomal protein L18 [Candidatus Saganbacteria bacterium]|nr:50S ribosomal protein L18 [Candidatus Saganbacteria bacterium]